jgi:hypothetical protein
MVLVKIIVLIAAIFLAIIIIKYREKIVRIVGKNEWAERYLGAGGTYTFWILFALLIIVIALVWLAGTPWG